MDYLSIPQRDSVRVFQEITQLEDERLCIEILQSHGWHVDTAVETFLLGGGQGSGSGRQQSQMNNRNMTNNNHNANSNNTNANTNNNSNNGNNDDGSTDQGGNSWVMNLLSTPIKWLFQVRPASIDPDKDARQFIELFEKQYGDRPPNTIQSSHISALQTCFQSHKLLLVYIHSPMHEDTDRFCKSVLCSDAFTDYMRGRNDVMFWMGNIWDVEAYNLSSQLKVQTYPFLGLLVCQSGRKAQIVDRIQGFTNSAQLIRRITNGVMANMQFLQRNRMEAERRADFVSLREEQDREFILAEEEARRTRERKLREERERQEQEEAERQQKELEAAIELSKKLSRESELARKRKRLEECPEPSEANPNAKNDIATIRFQLPNGVKLSRKFLKTDPIERLYDYVLVYFADNGIPSQTIMISSNFPKKDFDVMNESINDAGLFPRGVLFVEDRDYDAASGAGESVMSASSPFYESLAQSVSSSAVQSSTSPVLSAAVIPADMPSNTASESTTTTSAMSVSQRKIRLGDEPSEANPDHKPNIATIRFQLPNGSKLNRKFLRYDSVEKLYDFVLTHLAETGSDIRNIMISTNFPKRDITDMSQTIEGADLFPRGVLLVQNLDA